MFPRKICVLWTGNEEQLFKFNVEARFEGAAAARSPRAEADSEADNSDWAVEERDELNTPIGDPTGVDCVLFTTVFFKEIKQIYTILIESVGLCTQKQSSMECASESFITAMLSATLLSYNYASIEIKFIQQMAKESNRKDGRRAVYPQDLT
ncbi:hypothetical protein CEXT_648901 [Caerostris extrusa]|uniref:PiggyBac transposable element-derived protein domain-containing protein n=1 Tax=Caerostris extrusa TaxID=172846 RepID=A0AAV4WCT7_CAEEX|nr:hypothetical protein CEXT_648901 [Caerostris extrusa]